jgi:hypothetical protein
MFLGHFLKLLGHFEVPLNLNRDVVCRARPYLVMPCAPLRHRGGGHSAVLVVPSACRLIIAEAAHLSFLHAPLGPVECFRTSSSSPTQYMSPKSERLRCPVEEHRRHSEHAAAGVRHCSAAEDLSEPLSRVVPLRAVAIIHGLSFMVRVPC